MTIEDLATKIGSVVSGRKIKGDKYVATIEDEVTIVMGKCPDKFRYDHHKMDAQKDRTDLQDRLMYMPVVFTFSFTSKELQAKPLDTLQSRFEPAGIKLLTDYSVQHTTHVVSKKRNTAKGLQALVNGRYIVTETFLDAITDILPQTDNTDSSSLEQDFDKYWPDAALHLPPRGAEPFDHPDSIYAPDAERIGVFEGYTFVFYDQNQFNNLLAPITNGSGKALLESVTPDKTSVDDFVGYVKNVAGEKGLGRFDDGSEGKGVVLVRYLPAKGDHVQWYAGFFTAVSLRLDHRPIEQNEFLEAILIKDASMLRRPLEVEELPRSATAAAAATEKEAISQPSANVASQSSLETASYTRRSRTRGPIKRRFAGFDDEVDITMDDIQPVAEAETEAVIPPEPEGGLFVSQEPDVPDEGSTSLGKRPASSRGEDDLMEGMAPAVARLKRQRLERGEDFASADPEPEQQAAPAKTAAKTKKKKKELDILAEAARHREHEEAQARAEKEDLAHLPDDIDLAEIRRLNIVEEMEVKVPDKSARTQEQDVADGRWDPKWNGVKNFKKFRKRGQVTGRQPARVIISLTEVQNKEFGIGDKYWLEEESSSNKRPSQGSSSHRHEQVPATDDVQPLGTVNSSLAVSSEDDSQPVQASRPRRGTTQPASGTTSTRATQPASRSASARTTQSQSLGKRSTRQDSTTQPAKKTRPNQIEVADSDSDDELRFRFGRRR